MLKKLQLTTDKPFITFHEESGFCELNLLGAQVDHGDIRDQQIPCIRFLLSSPFYSVECCSNLEPGSRNFIPMDLLQTAAEVLALEGAPFYTVEIRAEWPDANEEYCISGVVELLRR